MAKILDNASIVKLTINTSFDVSGQCDQLSEAFPLKVPAEVVVLIGAKVKVPYHQCVLVGVDEVLQDISCTGQRFFL